MRLTTTHPAIETTKQRDKRAKLLISRHINKDIRTYYTSEHSSNATAMDKARVVTERGNGSEIGI